MSHPCCEHCAEDPIHDVELDEHDLPCTLCSDSAPFLVAARDRDEARAERDAALAAVERVKALHVIHLDGPTPSHWCSICHQPWPCPTIQALEKP